MSLNNSKTSYTTKTSQFPLRWEHIWYKKIVCGAEGSFLATKDSPGTPARPSPWSPSAGSLARSRTPPQRESDPQWTRDQHRNRWWFFRIAFLFHFRGLLYERKEEIERGKERRKTEKREKKHDKEPTHLSQTQLCIAWVHLVLSWNLKEAKSSVSLSVYKVLVDSWGIFCISLGEPDESAPGMSIQTIAWLQRSWYKRDFMRIRAIWVRFRSGKAPVDVWRYVESDSEI